MRLATRVRAGQTLIEYVLLIMLIGALSMGAMTVLGVSIGDMLSTVSSAVGVNSAPSGGGGDSDACASGFEPGSTVTINYGPLSGDPLLPSGSFEATADENGEIAECEGLVLPIEVDSSEEYEQTFVGFAPGGAPISQTVPTEVSSPAVPNAPVNMFGAITFDTPATSLGTMTVRVRSCSSIYHRAEPTMASYGYLLAPGTEFEVYATDGWWNSTFGTAITGGTWPTYTCDGGTANTWYRLTDGSGYVFTGGVDIVPGSIVPGAVTYPAALGWPGTWTAGAGEDGSGAMLNSGTTYGPKFPAVPGNTYTIRATIKGVNNGQFGICFYDSSNVQISCDSVWVEQSAQHARFNTNTVSAPAAAATYAARFAGSITYDNILSFENGVPGPAPEPDWAVEVPVGMPPATTQTFDSAALAGWPGTRTAGIGQDGSAAMRSSGSAWAPWYSVSPGDTYRIRLWVKGSNNDQFSVCFYTVDRVNTRCSGYWTEFAGWGIYDTTQFTVAGNEVLMRLRFEQAFDYDNLQFRPNGTAVSEPAWSNPPLVATRFGPFDFNAGAVSGMPGTWGASSGPDGSGAMSSSSGTTYTQQYSAVAGHTYQGFADIRGANNRQFGICFYNANHVATWCGANWTEQTSWAAKTTPSHVASSSEVSYALYFVGSLTYDNLRATDNGS